MKYPIVPEDYDLTSKHPQITDSEPDKIEYAIVTEDLELLSRLTKKE